MSEFLYNVIARENAAEYNLSPEWWKAHPEWNFYVRTNVRASHNPRVWLGGGGATEEEALAAATESVEADAGKSARLSDECVLIVPAQARGTLTREVIKNR